MIESPLLKQVQSYVDGKWRGSDSGATVDVKNPATGELLAQIPAMGKHETHEAINAAERAMDSPLSIERRGQLLGQIADLLTQNKSELARIITMEQGKPLKESEVEVDVAVAFFRYYQGQLHHLAPKPLEQRVRNLQWTVHHRPAGVAATITPWNFPLVMLAKKLPAAIGAGCAVVSKPAELTPLTCIALWHLFEQLGLPPGWLNLVIGSPQPIGDIMCSHPAVRVVSFTGSTATGRLLITKTAPYVKRMHMELGGNAPYIVFDDADIVPAVDWLMANKFRCAGQTCVCANRIYVPRSIAGNFTDALVDRVSKLRVGNGLEDGVDVGPLINEKAVTKVDHLVSDALGKGATRVSGAEHREGLFYTPGVITNTTPDMALSREEIFGPVIATAEFQSEDDAIALANSTPYGLAAYIFTRDPERARRVCEKIHFGHVGVNTGMGPTPEAPFGGMKQSGFGREGGVEGLLEYCESQTVVTL